MNKEVKMARKTFFKTVVIDERTELLFAYNKGEIYSRRAVDRKVLSEIIRVSKETILAKLS